KSTQLKLLAESLRNRGYKVTETREPGGTPLGEEIRRLVLQFKHESIADEAELLLFGASRAQLVRKLIEPELLQGNIVLCDRFADSTTAYQGEARGLNLDFIRAMHEFSLGGRWPDLTFFLDLEVNESFRRLRKVKPDILNDDRFEEEGRNFHQDVRNGFLKLARENPQRIRHLDATRGISELAEQILQEVCDVLG
ncbi:MAG: dTMP kinase, partial [Lentisphaeria bacterium]|nr:dTMP kinase [Lentisphaeria bacterium]